MILSLIIIALVLALGSVVFVTKTERGRELWNAGLALYIKTRGNLPQAWREVRSGQYGNVTIQGILMIFILIVIIYQLIPQVSSSNATLQASSNASSMAKWAGGLGEWLFPLLGIMAIVFMLWQGRGKKSKGI